MNERAASKTLQRPAADVAVAIGAFTVTLSAAYDQAVTMPFRRANGTATTSDGDYGDVTAAGCVKSQARRRAGPE